jgi:NTE family protein
MRHALILGAGGPAAAAFEIGIVAGLADGGLDVRDADVFVGTSAGALVAVELAGDASIDDLFHRRVIAIGERVAVDMKSWGKQITELKEHGGSASEILRRVGKLALTVPSRACVAEPQTWPRKRVMIVAVECESGERRAFERTSGAPLVDAVAASGALPGVRPAIEIGGRHYMDGGMYSTDNADLAASCDRALVIALRAGQPRLPLVGFEDTTRAFSHVEIIQPDDASQAALAAVGGNILDPNVGPLMVRAARKQGQRLAGRIMLFWRGRDAA